MTVRIIVEFSDGDITKGNYTFTDIESIDLVQANDFAITDDQNENERKIKINDGLIIAKKLQDESEKMINTEGMEDLDEYFLNL